MTSMDASRGATWGVGSTIETSASILFGNFVPFVGTALVAGLPGLAFSQVVSSDAAQSAVNFIIAQIVTVTLIYGAMQALRRRQIAISECLTQGFRRLGAALGVAIVAGICIAIGIVALIVPGLILATIWAVAIPAATIEQAGVGASLSRSAALTRERRWRVFGAVLVAGLIALLVGAHRRCRRRCRRRTRLPPVRRRDLGAHRSGPGLQRLCLGDTLLLPAAREGRRGDRSDRDGIRLEGLAISDRACRAGGGRRPARPRAGGAALSRRPRGSRAHRRRRRRDGRSRSCG